MKRIFFLTALTLYTLNFSCNSESGTNTQPDRPVKKKTAEEIRQELKEKEMQSPEVYLRMSEGKFRENFIGEIVVEGRITNTATLATFKDMVVEVDFLAASGTNLGSQRFTRYEVLGPGYSVTYKFKAFAHKETKSVRATLVNATPIN